MDGREWGTKKIGKDIPGARGHVEEYRYVPCEVEVSICGCGCIGGCIENAARKGSEKNEFKLEFMPLISVSQPSTTGTLEYHGTNSQLASGCMLFALSSAITPMVLRFLPNHRWVYFMDCRPSIILGCPQFARCIQLCILEDKEKDHESQACGRR